jgi:hypothetical protein
MHTYTSNTNASQVASFHATHTASDTDQDLRDSVGHRVPGAPERERYQPHLERLVMRGDGAATIQLRRRTAAGVWSDVGTPYPISTDKDLVLEDFGPNKISTNWPDRGERLGYSISLGTATRVTLDGSTGLIP